MTRLMKVNCIWRKPNTPQNRPLLEEDVYLFDQWLESSAVVAVCPAHEYEILPMAKSIIVLLGNQSFQTTEEVDDLALRVNRERISA